MGGFAGDGGEGPAGGASGPAPDDGPAAPAWDWDAGVPAGERGVLGTGAAQGSAFPFGEVYEARTGEVAL